MARIVFVKLNRVKFKVKITEIIHRNIWEVVEMIVFFQRN